MGRYSVVLSVGSYITIQAQMMCKSCDASIITAYHVYAEIANYVHL